MIGYLQGEILENVDGKILLVVGDRKSFGAVGYSISVPQNLHYDGLVAGKNVELFVYTHVREDSLDLYGFSSKFEKNLFLILLTVTGIGPKSGLSILSAVEPAQLVDAIVQGDQSFFTRISGIGKKTADRMIVELKDVMKKKLAEGVLISHRERQKSSRLALNARVLDSQLPNFQVEKGDSMSVRVPTVFQDAKAALINLGYREQEIQFLLERVSEGTDSTFVRAEDLIRAALRQLL